MAIVAFILYVQLPFAQNRANYFWNIIYIIIPALQIRSGRNLCLNLAVAKCEPVGYNWYNRNVIAVDSFVIFLYWTAFLYN